RMAPGQNYGIAILEDGGVAVLDAGAGQLAIRKLNQALANPDAIAFSPSGSSALLYAKADGRLQTLGNLGAAATLLRETSAAGAVALAVSDDGQWTAFANSSGVWAVDASGALRRAAGQSDVTAAAFRPNSAFLVFASGKALFSVAIATAGSDAVLVKDELDSISAVAQSADGAYLFARTGSGVTVVRTVDGETTQVACDCEVTSFEGMKGRNVFRLSDAGIGPAYLFDGGGAVPRIVFVPGQAPVEVDLPEGGAQ
ncbi:MAG: WD40 repeat domain-containing protein, partial [Acidobacteria bacterium]|nr:WD40 repeat domain-containing protein [Acidobacteriota bacterium]